MTIKSTIFDTGYCTHLERMVINDGRFKIKKFPALFGHIKHKTHGDILYDTGYTDRFFRETTKLPEKIYAKITPVYFDNRDSAHAKLLKKNIKAEDIKYIIISHFHADHIGGLKDFPNAKFIYISKAYSYLKNMGRWRATLNGFLPKLLPKDFIERSLPIELFAKKIVQKDKMIGDFNNCYDLFDDNSLIAVEMPGHAYGQLGLFLNDPSNKKFFIADSCWMSRSFEKNIPPHKLADLISNNKNEFLKTLLTLHKFHKQNPTVTIIPTHCGRKFQLLAQESNISLTDMNGLE